MAYYKLDQDNNFLSGNWVLGPYDSFYLTLENKDTNQYPVDGWYWFDTEAEARTFFNLPPLEEE
jgi:hypothetical protein